MILGAGIGWLEEEFDGVGGPLRRARAAHRGGHRRHAGPVVRRSRRATQGSTTDISRLLPATAAPGRDHSRCTWEVTARLRRARAGRIGDGFFPLGVTRDEWSLCWTIMRRSAEEAGRDPATIEVTVSCTATAGEEALAEVADLERLGVDPCDRAGRDVPGGPRRVAHALRRGRDRSSLTSLLPPSGPTDAGRTT